MKIGNKKIKWGVFLSGIGGLIFSLWLIFGPGIEDVPIGKLNYDNIEELKDTEIGKTKIEPADAAQNWPTTDSSTGHQTDHLTNNPQRDDSLRSNFSGTTCPGSPVEGQHCYDTDDDVLYVYDGGSWNEIWPKTAPCFSVHRNGTDQTPSGITKIQWTTESYDTNNNFDSSTNYRFTPTVAGKYIFTSALFHETVSEADVGYVYLYKNGASVNQGAFVAGHTTSTHAHLTTIQDANGTTDYFEIFGFNSGNQNISGGSDITFWMGCKIG